MSAHRGDVRELLVRSADVHAKDRVVALQDRLGHHDLDLVRMVLLPRVLDLLARLGHPLKLGHHRDLLRDQLLQEVGVVAQVLDALGRQVVFGDGAGREGQVGLLGPRVEVEVERSVRPHLGSSLSLHADELVS